MKKAKPDSKHCKPAAPRPKAPPAEFLKPAMKKGDKKPSKGSKC